MTRKWLPKSVDMPIGRAKGSWVRRSTATGMLCLRWVDRKTVTMLSTCHDSTMLTLQDRRGRDYQKPEVVYDYNYGMKGVDLSDQYAKSYPMNRKSPRWFKKLYFYLLDMVITNALCVHQYLGGPLNNLKFRWQLVGELQRTGPQPARPPMRALALQRGKLHSFSAHDFYIYYHNLYHFYYHFLFYRSRPAPRRASYSVKARSRGLEAMLLSLPFQGW